MNSVNKSVLRVNKFFKQLKNYTTNKIIIHTDRKNALFESNIPTRDIIKFLKLTENYLL